MAMLVALAVLMTAIIANVLGPSGHGLLGAREASWLLTLALMAAALIVAGTAVRSRWDGIFIDRDNRISLSRFQLILWTLIILSAWLTAGLTNVTGADTQPLAIRIPPEIWALLGLGGFTAVAAPAIKEGQKRAAFRFPATVKGGDSDGPKLIAEEIKQDQGLSLGGHYVNRVFVKESSSDASWVDLINGDYEGASHVDVSKLQQLVFTVVLAVTYAFAVWTQMKLGPFKSFPTVYPEFVALLGISQGTYLADKQVGSS